jgi:hypothetical protein
VDGKTRAADDPEAKRVWPQHAGACGACSNPRDIAVYHRTRHTLTDQAVGCAFRYLAFGRQEAKKCLDRIGFTDDCAGCWADNIACTATHCRGVCLTERLLSQPNNAASGALSPCLQCDEDHCGPAFKACAGANRRRVGIHSDIERPDDQVWQRVLNEAD